MGRKGGEIWEESGKEVNRDETNCMKLKELLKVEKNLL